MTGKKEISTELMDKLEKITALDDKLSKIAKNLEGSRFEDVLHNYSNPWRIVKINLLVGLARGVGLTVGTGIFLAILFYTMSKIISIPLIGEYIVELMQWVEEYQSLYKIE